MSAGDGRSSDRIALRSQKLALCSSDAKLFTKPTMGSDSLPSSRSRSHSPRGRFLPKVVIPSSVSSLQSRFSTSCTASINGDSTPETSAAPTPAGHGGSDVHDHLSSPTRTGFHGGKRRLPQAAYEDVEYVARKGSQRAKRHKSQRSARIGASPAQSTPNNPEEALHASFLTMSTDHTGCIKSSQDIMQRRSHRRRTTMEAHSPLLSEAVNNSSLRAVMNGRITKNADIDEETDADSVHTSECDESDDFTPSEILHDSDNAADGEHSISAQPDMTMGDVVRPHERRRPRSQRTNRVRRRRSGQMDGDRAARERLKLEKAHPEIITMWHELGNVPIIQASYALQPSAITRSLKSFQLQGLDWMMKQEQSTWRGGLLGDEMGMGKTIQTVSLIMSDYPATSPTLVVVPPVALLQWQNEIAQYTSGKLNVLIYHNTNPRIKNMKLSELRAFDIIMISYAGLESTYRKESKGWKRDDGLIKENSKIHAIKYHRLILDEAHNIKTRTTSVAKACFALHAKYRWCLSGTPVQNRIGEFFSLLRFLQVKPFASYFCKKCPCAELHWAQDANKRCNSCSHTGFEHVSIFNQELLNPITQQMDPELRREALRKLRLITDRIMLRRMKRDYTAAMELPPKKVLIHNEFFGEIERDFSSSIMSNTTRQFDTYVSRGVMLNNYANIFGLIMQMRQVANHPDLILKKHSAGGQNVLTCSICDETAEEPIRSRCHHEFCRKCAKDFVQSAGAEFPDCPRCHIALSIDFDQPDIEQDEETVKRSSIINRIKMENWTSSTKIEMLVYDLFKLRSPKQTHKSIVFSQFTSMLQLVEWRLRRAGFKTVMLDGSMSPVQRQKSIEHFMNNTDVEVFLVSLKAGGVALNLTEASRVFIVDPWWNPAAEWQSADRCHRIGQKRPCVITRLCIEDSVESRMVLLQEKKANMISGTINNDQVAMEKLTPEDMQFLFRGG